MSEDQIIRNMRHMAWERAKGELQSILHTYWGHDARYAQIEDKITEFIESVEGPGLHE